MSSGSFSSIHGPLVALVYSSVILKKEEEEKEEAEEGEEKEEEEDDKEGSNGRGGQTKLRGGIGDARTKRFKFPPKKKKTKKKKTNKIATK